jgi:hypothetical protein
VEAVQDGERTISQQSLWDGSSLGTKEGKRLPLEAGTRGLVRDRIPIVLSAFVVNCSQTVCESPRVPMLIVIKHHKWLVLNPVSSPKILAL